VADHLDTSAQGGAAGGRAEGRRHSCQALAARDTNHSKLNENLGLPHVPPTKALFEFVDEALKK